jgi:hypothetical protein
MAVFPRPLVLLPIGIVCVLSLLWVFAARRASHTIMTNSAATDLHQMDADALEREIRGALPTGSSLVTVEGFLNKRGIEFSFEAPSKTILAAARKLKGSTLITRHDLTFKFHFDDSLKLKSIDAKLLYTGP